MLLTFAKDVQGGRFRTQPWYSGRRCRARLSKGGLLEFKRQRSTTPPKDQIRGERFTHFRWLLASRPVFPFVPLARLAQNTCDPTLKGFNANICNLNDGQKLFLLTKRGLAEARTRLEQQGH